MQINCCLFFQSLLNLTTSCQEGLSRTLTKRCGEEYKVAKDANQLMYILPKIKQRVDQIYAGQADAFSPEVYVERTYGTLPLVIIKLKLFQVNPDGKYAHVYVLDGEVVKVDEGFEWKCCFAETQKPVGRKVIAFLIDGFRWNYFDRRQDLNGLVDMMTRGVKAEYVKPVYQTVTFANLYSLMTGTYSETHGMVANNFFDSSIQKGFITVDGTQWSEENEQPYWWDSAEPIWIGAERQAVKTAMYHWPGCQVTIRGLRPSHCVHRQLLDNSAEQMEATIDDALQRLRNDTSFVGLYFVGVDQAGHAFGPDSPQVTAMIKQIDNSIVSLLEKISSNGMADEVDVMIFSDHGFTNTDKVGTPAPNKLIPIEIDWKNDIAIGIPEWTAAHLWPQPESFLKVYQQLKALSESNGNFHVYLKDEIPERWHYKNTPRIAPIIVVADEPYQLHWLNQDVGPVPYLIGGHGFDNENENMRAAFVASGPSFKNNRVVPAIEAVDVYQVMAFILGIEPAPNNGSWARVADMINI